MDFSYADVYDASVAGVFLGILGVVFLVALAVAIFMIVVTWKLFQKAGKPGWAAIVPFYKDYVMAEISWGNGWFFLIAFASIIPGIGSIAVLIFMVMSQIKLSKAFGKDGGFAVGLIFLNPIFLAILAFGKSEYVGVDENINPFSNNNQYNMNYNNNGNYSNNNQENINNTVVDNNQINNGSPRFCTNCGTKLENNASFCTNCGSKVN